MASYPERLPALPENFLMLDPDTQAREILGANLASATLYLGLRGLALRCTP